VVFQPDGKGFADTTTDYGPVDEHGVDMNRDDDQSHIRLWNYPELTYRLTIHNPHPKRAVGLTFSTDGRLLYSWTGSAASPEWNLKHTGKRRESVLYKEPIRVWDTATGEQVDEIHGLIEVVSVMYMLSDNWHLLMHTSKWGGDDSLTLLNVETHEVVSQFSYPDEGYRQDVVLSPNGETIAVGQKQGVVLVDIVLPNEVNGGIDQ